MKMFTGKLKQVIIEARSSLYSQIGYRVGEDGATILLDPIVEQTQVIDIVYRRVMNDENNRK